MRCRTPWRSAGVAIAAIGLALSGCATGRSVQQTVTGWFGAGSAGDDAATARRKPRRAASEAATSAPEPEAPEGAASGAEEPTDAPDAKAPPDAPEKSIFDPY